MPTISWDETFGRCARAALAALQPGDEALIVFDGIPPVPPAWLLDGRTRLLSTEHRQGPAAARNLAASEATGLILVFIDADVEIHPDALDRLRAHFATDPDRTAVFGSYDDQPAAPGLVSRFRNLLHHYTHSSQPGPASSFWAGCGAIRRDAFLAMGGFDAEGYPRPSIEDIELGLRLSDRGGRIELDPAIQGKHHKRWTLRSMLVTDIRQRAIPWSQLLLRRRELPATLNLTPTARLSAAASLVVWSCGPAALVWPDLGAWVLLAFCCCLSLLLILNRGFHRLLVQRTGWLHGGVGVGLHALFLAYSSLTYAAVAGLDLLRRPLRAPTLLRASPRQQRLLVVVGLGLLLLLAGAVVANGLTLGWKPLGGRDLGQRFDEWRLFQMGIYPSRALATATEQAIPHFRTTVYLPWALPLFGVLFAGGGLVQGKLLTQGLSLLALIPIMGIGWRSLRPWGLAAAWLGALAPVAIAGNSNCLGHPQFSIICMGLVSLQWLLLKQERALPAGLCWALAMVKPQIAAPFALPLFQRGQRRGLWAALALLLALSAAALLHTATPPFAFLASWFQVLPAFVATGNRNALGWMVSAAPPAAVLAGGMAVAMGLGVAIATAGWGRRPWPWLTQVLQWNSRAWQRDPLTLAGVLAVVAQLGFYHLPYDNILLFPALLACMRLLLQKVRIYEAVLTVLTAISLWMPQRLLDLWPDSAAAQAAIWLILGLTLAWHSFAASRESR